MRERTAGAPPDPTKSAIPPTPQPPPVPYGDVVLSLDGKILLPDGEEITPVEGMLRATAELDIAVVNDWTNLHMRNTNEDLVVRWVAPVWLKIPHTPTIPALGPPPAPAKPDRTGLVPTYLVVDWADRHTVPLYRRMIDMDGNILSDDVTMVPPGHTIDEIVDGCRYVVDPFGWIVAQPTNGDPVTVYYRESSGRLSRVYLAPKEEPTTASWLRSDPLRQQIMVGAGVVYLFLSLVTLGVFLLPGAVIVGSLFWFLWFHPRANPMPEDYFA